MTATEIATRIATITDNLLPGSVAITDELHGIPSVTLIGDDGMVTIAPCDSIGVIVRVQRHQQSVYRRFITNTAGVEQFIANALTN
jgi:hypothetical protein